MPVAKKKMCVEGKYVPMGTSYVPVVFLADFWGQHAHPAHYAESL